MSDDEEEYEYPDSEDDLMAPDLERQDSQDSTTYSYQGSDNEGGAVVPPQLVADCEEFNDALRLEGLKCGYCRPGLSN